MSYDAKYRGGYRALSFKEYVGNVKTDLDMKQKEANGLIKDHKSLLVSFFNDYLPECRAAEILRSKR